MTPARTCRRRSWRRHCCSRTSRSADRPLRTRDHPSYRDRRSILRLLHTSRDAFVRAPRAEVGGIKFLRHGGQRRRHHGADLELWSGDGARDAGHLHRRGPSDDADARRLHPGKRRQHPVHAVLHRLVPLLPRRRRKCLRHVQRRAELRRPQRSELGYASDEEHVWGAVMGTGRGRAIRKAAYCAASLQQRAPIE